MAAIMISDLTERSSVSGTDQDHLFAGQDLKLWITGASIPAGRGARS